MIPLHWRQPDPFHIRSLCGRYTVARVRSDAIDTYIAYRCEPSVAVERAIELGCKTMPDKPTDAQRLDAIQEMRSLCQADADRVQGAAGA